MTYYRVTEDQAVEVQPGAARRAAFEASHLEILMFHVGHGEAVLLVFPGRRAWLVDAGCSNHDRRNGILGDALVDYMIERDLTLEVIVPSHAHIDHAGAIPHILSWDSTATSAPITMYRSRDGWNGTSNWLARFNDALGWVDDDVEIHRGHREIPVIPPEVEAHLFAWSGQGAYTSLFTHLRYHGARLLFTGDSKCRYEGTLIDQFGADDFRADVLKVTHHGSSSGTGRRALAEVRPGIAIASTGEDSGHRLEADTLERLEEKGYVASREGQATARRGGRAKRHFRLKPAGVRALWASREMLERMWKGLDLPTPERV